MLDDQVSALAASQHGIFSLEQLVDLGLAAPTIHKRARTGRLHRIHRGVYALVPAQLLSVRGGYMAAVLACGPRAMLSHRSAADLLGLRATSRRRIDITLPGRTVRSHGGIDIHRSTTLTAADITVVDGIRCTTVARTHLDLAGLVSRDQVERALNQSEALRVFDHGALMDQLDRNPHHPGAGTLSAALALYAPDRSDTESRLEDRFLELCRSAGLPEPECQAWLVLEDGEPAIRVDFLWRAARLVLEADSRKWHGTDRSFETDRRRDQRLTRARWRVVRVTWRQLRDVPQTIVGLVADLLGVSADA